MRYKISDERHIRTAMAIGYDNLDILKNSKILIFGCGGVGSFVCEALGRIGVGEIHLVDKDVVSESNINRQIIADYSTVGRSKTELVAERLKLINPDVKVVEFPIFYLPESEEAKQIDFSIYDYVVDAIDTTSAKIDIIVRCKSLGVRVISSMGTGNKVDNSKLKIADIKDTSVCPLAKIVRKELRKRNISDVKVLYSEEEPRKAFEMYEGKKAVPASVSFVPSTAGLLIAGYVVRDILGIN